MRPNTIRTLALVCIVLASALCSGRAYAYTWMIRQGYTTCATCHADPSGGGLLTQYGRAQGELLLRTHYSKKEQEDPGAAGKFLWGAFTPPDNVLLGGDFRTLAYRVMPKTGGAQNDLFLMQSDLQGQVSFDRVRVNASVGFAQKGASAAAITNAPGPKMVSRVHWLGVDLGAEREFLLRAGRMNLPFGLRSVEHTAFIRSSTRTDINTAQSHGAALSYNSEQWRGEVMALLGNYQLSPDRFRERGYAGYLEFAPFSKLAVGVSSLAARSEKDPRFQASLTRQAHGVFARYSPVLPVVLLAEFDFLIDSIGANAIQPSRNESGSASMFQVDFGLLQGVHLMGLAEMLKRSSDSGATYSLWGTVNWFFYSHTDVRIDLVYQSFPVGPMRTSALSLLGQLHFYL